MKMIQISIQEWEAGIAALRSNYRLFGPVDDSSGVRIRELEEGEQPDLGLPPTRFSPKNLTFPQSQVMFEYSLDRDKEDYNILKEVKTESSQRAIFGLKPCDAAALNIVKRNFDNPEYPDQYWLDNYNSLTMVGTVCDDPRSTCFCLSTDGGPYNEEGLDVLLMPLEQGYAAKVITDRGAVLMKEAGWTTEADFSEFDERKQAAEAKIASKIETDGIPQVDVNELFEAPFWDDISFACLNCGTCTYSCPTCWCFDIQDEVRGKQGVRIRNWDSCMYPLFTLEGSGHNPRTAKKQRVRQRFMHKLKYYPEKYDAGVQCVGCGRCIRLCPVNIDIRVVCDKMNRYQPVNA